MNEILSILRESLPEAIGGVIVAILIAIFAIFRKQFRTKNQHAKPTDNKSKASTRSEIYPLDSFSEAEQKTILIVEDEVKKISGLFRPLMKEGYNLIVAETA